nr:MAG TPA: hypothetical protein [Caudoviricetes sp.]
MANGIYSFISAFYYAFILNYLFKIVKRKDKK